MAELKFMWVKQQTNKPSPNFTIFIGGMFAIPRKMGGKHDIVLPTLY